jgi:hypothetical protein
MDVSSTGTVPGIDTRPQVGTRHRVRLGLLPHSNPQAALIVVNIPHLEPFPFLRSRAVIVTRYSRSASFTYICKGIIHGTTDRHDVTS